MNHTTPCDPGRLRRLLDDELPPGRRGEVIGHLDGCPACQEALERLAAPPAWWQELRGIKGAATPVPPPLSQLSGCREGLALTTPFRPASAPAAPAGPDVYLGFLDPPGASGGLGRLGPFVVTGVLGQGGMGVVLEAFDAALDRTVAIKVLSPHLASNAAARTRFAREARAAAAVVHPHVVAVHAVDAWNGLPYLVMTHVVGRSLQERLGEGPLPLTEVLRVGAQAAEGLAAAHARGLIHRDVKPANILLEADTGRALLTDFGLARAADEAGLTQSGVIPGTPQYMAPEQARGEASDHRADLFSLGSTLYALCAGAPPFGADAPLAVLRRVCAARPRPLRAVAPNVPDWMARLIEKLHAADPDDRCQSAAEVAGLLAGCLAHVLRPGAVPLPPALARGRPPRGRLARWAAVVGALGGLGVAATWGLLPPPDPGPPPRAPGRAARDRGQPKPGGQRLEAPIDQQLQDVAGRMGALEAEWRQQAGQPGDPFDQQVQELRQRLRALEHALAPPAKQPTSFVRDPK
jgi:serine/threonine-protein kinase